MTTLSKNARDGLYSLKESIGTILSNLTTGKKNSRHLICKYCFYSPIFFTGHPTKWIEEKPKEAPKHPEVIPPSEEHKEEEACSEEKPKAPPKEEESLFIPPKKILTKPAVKKKSVTVVKVASLTKEIEDNIVIDYRTICECAYLPSCIKRKDCLLERYRKGTGDCH